jgi:drug/metabolite transporter (DMT)-like permease
VLIEHFFTRNDRLTARKSAGLLLAFGGVALLLLGSEKTAASSQLRDTPTLLGDAILLLSAFILALKVVYTKHALKVVEPGKLIFWHDLIGVVLFCIFSALLEQVAWGGFTTPAVLALIYQGVFVAGICFAVQARLLRRHSASQIAVFSFVTPIVGVTAGALLRGDELTPLLFVAAAFVAFGILLVNLPEAAEP